DRPRMPRVEPDRDERVRVVEADAERLVAMIQDHHLVARGETGFGGLDLVAEDPGVAGAEPAVLVLGQPDRGDQGLRNGASDAAPAALRRARARDSPAPCWPAWRRRSPMRDGPGAASAPRCRTPRPGAARIPPAGA